MARTRADFNWALPARVALALSLLLAAWVLLPAGRCTVRLMQGAQLGGLSSDEEFNEWMYSGDQYRQDANADVRRVAEGSGFLAQFFGSVGSCARANPLSRAEPWKLQAAGGSFALFLLFSFAGRLSQRRAARRTAESRRGGIPKNTGGFATARTTRSEPAVPRDSTPRTPRPSGSHQRVNRPSAEHLALQSLDAGLAGETNRAPATTPAPLRLDDGFEDELDALLGAGPSSTAAQPAPPAAEPRTSVPAGPALFDEEDPFEDWSPAAAPTSASQPPKDALRYHDLGEQAAAVDIDDRSVRFGMRAPATWYLGTPLRIAIALESPSPRSLRQIRVAVNVISPDAGVHSVWDQPLALSDLPNADQLGSIGRALVDLPSDEIVRLCAREANDGNRSLRIQLLLDGDEVVSSVRVHDRISLEFQTDDGAALPPASIGIFAGGSVLRSAVGTDAPGRMVAGPLSPGRYRIRFEESYLLRTGADGFAHTTTIDTDGHARALGRLSGDAGTIRRLVAVAPLRVHVDASRGDDHEAAVGASTPFRTIRRALDAAVAARGDSMRVIEVLLHGPGLTARDRASLVAGGGSSSWAAWWEGRSVSASSEWTTPMSAATYRAAVLQRDLGAVFAEDIVLEELHHVTFVNAAWAELRGRAAKDADLSAKLDVELRRTPLVLLGAPDDPEQRAASRVHLRACRGIRFSGLHFFGVGGQAAFVIDGCEDVEIRDCWIDGFEAGATPQPTVWATGRAVTLRGSGHQHAPVVLDHCDLSYNSAVRPSVPISGAALHITESYLTLLRSTLHDNLANGEPCDVYVDRNSVLTGDANNHRAGNRVVHR